MCNPRRVEVSATRQLTQAWEHEVRRATELTAATTGDARVREPLDESIGAPTLVALVRVLDGAAGWRLDGESYIYDLDGGYLAYHADRRELEIVARSTSEVRAEGSAALLVRGQIDERIEASGVGRFYDDEWGGVTEDDARLAADADAQRNLAERERERLEEVRRAADQEHADDLARAAHDQASVALAELVGRRSAELSADAARRLTALGIQARNIFHQTLAEAYRDAILAYARSRGAEHISHTEQDGVLEIEFELRV